MERSGVEAWLPLYDAIRADQVGEDYHAAACALYGENLTGMGICNVHNHVEFVVS